MRLRRSDPSRPGYSRRRRGKGFGYTDTAGRPLTDPAELDRIRSLVIPPAWRDVWISPDPRGHIQAVGTDAADRRQYLYHEQWRRQRDEQKFDHVLKVAEHLPELRARTAADLRRRGLCRERVLAAVVRLIEYGLFRVGNDQYARGDDATYGVSTLLPEHVTLGRGRVEFRYPAKGGIERVCMVTDAAVRTVIRELCRRPGAERLFGFREADRWRDVRSEDVNGYLREASGVDMSAKDFRTWHATVLAAVLLAGDPPRRFASRGRRRVVARVMREVSEHLGNTPAVARASYVDPRVVDLYNDGVIVPVPDSDDTQKVEAAVLAMLRDA